MTSKVLGVSVGVSLVALLLAPTAALAQTPPGDAAGAAPPKAEAASPVGEDSVGSQEDAPPPLPPEGLPLPVYVPPDAKPKKKKEVVKTDDGSEVVLETGDSILYSGYLPGYRRHLGLGAGPYDPVVGALPGPTTPGYGAPMPPSEWTFAFAGFMNVSAQGEL